MVEELQWLKIVGRVWRARILRSFRRGGRVIRASVRRFSIAIIARVCSSLDE